MTICIEQDGDEQGWAKVELEVIVDVVAEFGVKVKVKVEVGG